MKAKLVRVIKLETVRLVVVWRPKETGHVVIMKTVKLNRRGR